MRVMEATDNLGAVQKRGPRPRGRGPVDLEDIQMNILEWDNVPQWQEP